MLPLILILLAPPSAFASKWLCAADLVTGFRYDSALKTWKQQNFIADEKLIIQANDGEIFGSKYKYSVTEVGDQNPYIFCKGGFNESGYLHCDILGTLVFNRINGRYTKADMLGFVNVMPPNIRHPTDEQSEDVFMTIGKCSPL